MLKLLMLLILLFVQVNNYAQNIYNFQHTLSDSNRMYFKLYDFTPQENKRNTYPLLVFLHGKGECGNDNEKQMHHLKAWLPDSLIKNHYNCYLLVPQIPVNHTWSYYNKHEQKLSFADSCPETQKVLIRVIDSLHNHLNINMQQTYIMGISMGAFGVTDIICRNPAKFAAAIAICGGGSPHAVNKKINTAFWLIHGKKDTTVPYWHTVNFYEKINALKPNTHRLTIYENINHAAWVKAFKEKDILSWLFSKKN